jgi:hypothetical protein
MYNPTGEAQIGGVDLLIKSLAPFEKQAANCLLPFLQNNKRQLLRPCATTKSNCHSNTFSFDLLLPP